MEQLKELAKELGQPGADKLWQEAQRRNLQVTRKEVTAYVRTLGSRQIFQARPKYDGKIVATEINNRWAADIVDYNARPSADPKDNYQVRLSSKNARSTFLRHSMSKNWMSA